MVCVNASTHSGWWEMNNPRDSINESILSKLGNHYNEQFSKQALR